MKVREIEERLVEEIIRHGKATVDLGFRMIEEVKSDLYASQRIVRWIEDIIKIINEKSLENQIKAKKALDRNERRLAREIILVTKVLEILAGKLVRVKDKIKSREKITLRTINKIEVKLRRINRIILDRIEEISPLDAIKQIHGEYRNLFTLKRQVEKINRAMNSGRELIEKTRTIIEEGIASEEIEDIIRLIGEEELQKQVEETLRHLERI